MTPEDDEFNRIEMESRIKQEYIRNMKPHVSFMSISMDDYLKLSDELALARTLIRELGDRLAKLEKPWVELTDEELSILGESFTHPDEGINEVDFGMEIQRILKEKNNG